MPQVLLHPPAANVAHSSPELSPLPQLLRTPSGLAILEIQGTLHVPSLAVEDGEPLENATSDTQIGKLVFPIMASSTDDTAWMKKVYLYVGRHQRLTGEVKKLAKPLALVRKKSPMDDSEPDSHEEELEIAEIIKYKLIFSQRPEPVGSEE